MQEKISDTKYSIKQIIYDNMQNVLTHLSHNTPKIIEILQLDYHMKNAQMNNGRNNKKPLLCSVISIHS